MLFILLVLFFFGWARGGGEGFILKGAEFRFLLIGVGLILGLELGWAEVAGLGWAGLGLGVHTFSSC